MSYPRIINAVFNSPWAIHRPWLGSVFNLMHSRVFASEQIAPHALLSGENLTTQLRSGVGGARQFADRWAFDKKGNFVNHTTQIHAAAQAEEPGDYYRVVREGEDQLGDGQILHIFGSGVMGKHLSSMEEMCAGGLSLDRMQSALRAARDDERVSAVMLQFDSPGGLVYGCTETHHQIAELAKKKHVTLFCDSLCASAAYWCGSSADHIYITPSAEVGSIGVYCAYMDYSEWCKQQGIAVTLIADGKHKGAGYPGTSLSEEQLALIKSEVLATGTTFRGDVRSARPSVSDDTMQGQCFTGEKAVSAGLADTVVSDLETALQDLALAI